MIDDIRHSARTLLKSLGFTGVAVLSLAIGIGSTAAVFSVADALLIRSLPGVADPERLVDVGRTQAGRPLDTMSYPNFADLRDRNTVFQGLAAYRPVAQSFGLTVDGVSQRVYGSAVSGNYFEVVGSRMALGRPLRSDDDRIGSPRAVIVLSHALWQRRFNRDPAVVGATVRLNGLPFTVVGVAAPGFTGTSVAFAELWLPIGVYGITSHSVAQRRKEIGIRVALGALRRQVLGMTVRQSLWLTTVGAAIGLAIAAGVAQLLTGLLYGIPPIDPVSFGGASLTLAFVALVASLVPAKRAASVNPVEALRTD